MFKNSLINLLICLSVAGCSESEKSGAEKLLNVTDIAAEKANREKAIGEIKIQLEKCVNDKNEQDAKRITELEIHLRSKAFKQCEKEKAAAFTAKHKNDAYFDNHSSTLRMAAIARGCHANLSQDDVLLALREKDYLNSDEYKRCRKEEKEKREVFMSQHKNDAEYKNNKFALKIAALANVSGYCDRSPALKIPPIERDEPIDVTNWDLSGNKYRCDTLRTVLEKMSR